MFHFYRIVSVGDQSAKCAEGEKEEQRTSHRRGANNARGCPVPKAVTPTGNSNPPIGEWHSHRPTTRRKRPIGKRRVGTRIGQKGHSIEGRNRQLALSDQTLRWTRHSCCLPKVPPIHESNRPLPKTSLLNTSERLD